MLRRFFALLAFLTGIVAIGAPVQPGMAREAAAAVEQADRLEAETPAPSIAAVFAGTPMAALGDRDFAFAPRPRLAIAIPTVMFGADRAYE